MNQINMHTNRPYPHTGAIGIQQELDQCKAKARAESMHLSQAVEAMPRSELDHAQEYMDAMIDHLSAHITRLENQLMPVVRPYPTGEMPLSAAPEDVAPLVALFGTRSTKIQCLTGRIDDLLRNLAI